MSETGKSEAPAPSGSSRKSPEPNRESFGWRFGQLVLRKRGEEGLTQLQLAGRAFDDEGRVNRISELEKGRVANPQRKTVDALVVALAITPEELAACGPPTAPQLPPGITADLGLTEGQLLRLAWDFGHENPTASLADDRQYLHDKAKEYRAFRDELQALKATDNRLSNLTSAAEAALDAGNIEDAEAILEDARTLSRDRTLSAAHQTAQIMALQARAALLRNDADTGFGHFTAAASMVAAIDVLEGISLRNTYSDTLRLHGERFSGTALSHAVALAEQNLQTCSRTDHPAQWAATQNNLAGALLRIGERVGGEAGLQALTRAVQAYEAALEVYTRADMPADWAMTQNNLAAALQVIGERAGGEAGLQALTRAVQAHEAALEVRTRADMPADWAKTQNNLAIALSVIGERAGGEAGLQALTRAVQAYETALAGCGRILFIVPASP